MPIVSLYSHDLLGSHPCLVTNDWESLLPRQETVTAIVHDPSASDVRNYVHRALVTAAMSQTLGAGT